MGHHVAIGQPRPDEIADLGEYLVLERGDPLDQPDLLGALDRLHPVDLVGHIDDLNIRQLFRKHRNQRMRHCAPGKQANLAHAMPGQVGDGERRVIVERRQNRDERGRAKNGADPARIAVGPAQLPQAAKRPHLHRGHRRVGIEDGCARVAVRRRDIREPAHIPAHPVFARMHDERVHAGRFHDLPGQRPAALHFSV